MKIEMGKTYRTRNGNIAVRILCTDGPGDQPVIGLVEGSIRQWYLSGAYRIDHLQSAYDLFEVGDEQEAEPLITMTDDPLANLEIDDLVLARDQPYSGWYPAHFAGIERGRPAVWSDGLTSHTCEAHFGTVVFPYEVRRT